MSSVSRSALRLSALVGVLGGLAPLALPAHAGSSPRASYAAATSACATGSSPFACLAARFGETRASSVRSLAVATNAAPAPPYTVVATGLDNPHGLTFGPYGALYVAEAGSGGTGTCVPNPDGGAPTCYGPSGAITRIRFAADGTPMGQQRVVTGLPSVAAAPGFSATGPTGLSFAGHNPLPYLIVQTPAVTATAPSPDGFGPVDGRNFGKLLRVFPFAGVGLRFPVSDIARYQAANIPYNGPDAEPKPDTDPYAVLADQASGGAYVVDAAANDLVFVDRARRVSTVAVFPDHSFPGSPISCGQAISPTLNNYCYQSVPDSITRGSDGALYVGELGGGGAPLGGSSVYRIVSGATTIQQPAVYQSGFTSIGAIAFGPDGSLYVLEIFEGGLDNADPSNPASLTGALIRVAPDGTRTTIASGPSGGLIAPTGLTISPDGKSAYVSNFGIFPKNGPPNTPSGQVVRFSL